MIKGKLCDGKGIATRKHRFGQFDKLMTGRLTAGKETQNFATVYYDKIIGDPFDKLMTGMLVVVFLL